MEDQRTRHLITFSPVLLAAGGIFWGWLWSSAIHVIPLFYIVAPIFDIAAYGFVGVKVNQLLPSVDRRYGQRIIFGILLMSLFYSGNRLIWHRSILHEWPFQEFQPWTWLPMTWVWEALVIIVGLGTALASWNDDNARNTGCGETG